MQKLPQRGRYCTEPTKKQEKKKVKTDGHTRSEVQYAVSTKTTSQEAVETLIMKLYKKTPDKLYRDVVAFPNIGEVSLFKKKLSSLRARWNKFIVNARSYMYTRQWRRSQPH